MRPIPILALCLTLAACGDEPPVESRVQGGDPERGERLVLAYGCPACHTIPGAAGPKGIVGPPLDRFGRRAYIGGVLPNTPDTLVRWIMDPPSLLPNTAMPDMGISEEEAAHIAAFLNGLR